jgi:hypothetical protein
MPSNVLKSQKFKEGDTVVCWTAFASDTPRRGTFVPKGARLKGGDPIVKAHSEFFAPDGLSDAELLALNEPLWARQNADAEKEQESKTKRERPPIPPEEQVECIEGFMYGGRFIGEGQILRRTDPAVEANKPFFVTPRRPLA